MQRLLKLLCLASLALASATAGGASAPGNYPTKPIRLIVPFAPGGGTDVVSRLVAQSVSESFGQPVIVDNRAGSGGLLGMEMTARASADGYTLGVVSGSIATNAAARKLSFDPVRDIIPVSVMAETGFLLTLNPGVQARNTNELVALAKASPGKLSYGSSGVGATSHLAAELFDLLAGTKMVHIPYKSTGPALTDLLSGQIALTYGSLPVVIPHMQSGRLRVLAITSPKRSKALPDVLTIAESGVPGYDVLTWYGVIAPQGLSKPMLARWHAAMEGALQSRAIQERFKSDGLEVPETGTRYFADAIRRDIAKWAVVFKKGDIRL